MPRRPPPGAPVIDRAAASKSPLVVIWAFCEGENTEGGWLEDLQRRFRKCNLRLEPCLGQGSPKSVSQRATEKRKEIKARKGSTAARDEVWAIFDRDSHPNVEEAIANCVSAGVGVVYSNECFELWPVLHFEENNAHTDRKLLQRRLHELHPGYRHARGANVDWSALEPSVHEAVARAKALGRQGAHAGDILRNPTTTAWLLRERCEAANVTDGQGLADGTWFTSLTARHRELHELSKLLPEPLRTIVQSKLSA